MPSATLCSIFDFLVMAKSSIVKNSLYPNLLTKVLKSGSVMLMDHPLATSRSLDYSLESIDCIIWFAYFFI